MDSSIRSILIALVAVLAIIAPALHAKPAAASPGEFIGSINSLRASKGLGGLSSDGALAAQAQRWAQKMADAGSISHNPALGSTPGGWSKVGENVGTGGTVGSIFNALVNSPGHYRNMVDPSFNRIGVGEVVKNGRIYTCHVFAAMPGGGGGSAPKASSPKSTGSAPARRPAASPTPRSQPVSTPAASSAPQAAASAPASSDAPTSESAPAGPTPSSRIVAGLAEVGAIPTQG